MALLTAAFVIPLVVLIFVVLVMLLVEHWDVSALEVKQSPLGGRGVYARRRFHKGEVVEVCPLLEGDDDDWGLATSDYTFKRGGRSALPLGYGAVYNHSDNPSGNYSFRGTDWVLTANRTIRPGEEITVSYGEDYWSSRVHVQKK